MLPTETKNLIYYQRNVEDNSPRLLAHRLTQANNNRALTMRLIPQIYRVVETHPQVKQESYGGDKTPGIVYTLVTQTGSLTTTLEAWTITSPENGALLKETLTLGFFRQRTKKLRGIEDDININGNNITASLCRSIPGQKEDFVDQVEVDLNRPAYEQIPELTSCAFLTVLDYFRLCGHIGSNREVPNPIDYLSPAPLLTFKSRQALAIEKWALHQHRTR